MSTSLSFGVPAKVPATEVVRACERLRGPLALRVETHRSGRQLRWFFLYGCEERAIGETVAVLLAGLPELTIAMSEDTTGFSSVRTFVVRRKRIVESLAAVNEGELEAVVSARFSGADVAGYLAGEGLEYGAKQPGWACYGRLEGKLTRDAPIEGELDLGGSALSWDELVDWEPGDAEPAPPPPPKPKRDKLASLRASLGPEPLTRDRDGDGEVWRTGTPIRWWTADGRGLVGRSSHDVGSDTFRVYWTTDPARAVATPRHVAIAETSEYGVGIDTVYLVDATHVYLNTRDTLYRVPRGGGEPQTVATARWFTSIWACAQDDAHVYLAHGFGLRRVAKADGAVSFVAEHDDLAVAQVALQSAGDALVVSGWRTPDGRTWLARVPKDGGPVQLLEERKEHRPFVAVGDLLFGVDGARPNVVWVERDGARREFAFERPWLRLFRLGDAVHVTDPGPGGIAIHAWDTDRFALLGRLADELAWVEIERERVLGYPARGDGLVVRRLSPPT